MLVIVRVFRCCKAKLIAEKSERHIAGIMKVSMGSQNVQKNKLADYQLSAVVSKHTANYNRLIIMNLPILEGTRQIDNILVLGRFILELNFGTVILTNAIS
jgi:hypothetical protein